MVHCVSAPAHRPFRVSFSHPSLFVLVLCAAAVAPVAAQPPVVVAGLVTDLSGGVLPGATIEARRGLRVLAVATTGVDGRYRLELPPDGAERVAARLAGFAPAAVDLTVIAGAATLDYDFGRVAAGEIERVEVVRGAQSALYGSDAIGSVIQIWHLDVDQRLGSRVDHAFTASYFRAGRQSDDGLADPRHVVRAVLAGQRGALYPDGPRLVRLLDPSAFDALAADPNGLGVGRFLAQSGPYSGYDYPFTFETQLRRPAARYQINATWLDQDVLSAGYDYYRETNALDDAQAVENHSWFVQQQFTIADVWFVTGGARVDDNAHYGTAVNPKLSTGGYPLPVRAGGLSSVKVSANIGRGIKNPTFSQLYGSQWVDGDLSLQPEQRVSHGRGVDVTVNPGYTLLTLGGQVRVHDDLTLFLRIDNAADAAYDSALGYPGLPRAVVAGGRFSIGG